MTREHDREGGQTQTSQMRWHMYINNAALSSTTTCCKLQIGTL